MSKSGFKELVVWKNAKDLAVDVYKMTNRTEFSKDFGLRDQLRRAVVSIPSNIAEGDERYTNRESIRFLYIAKGSLAELITQLDIAYEIGYLDREQLTHVQSKCDKVGKELGALIKARNKNPLPIKTNKFS